MQVRKSGTTSRAVLCHFVLLPISGFTSQVLYPGLPTLQSPMEPCIGSHPCTRDVRALFDGCLQATICQGLACRAQHTPAGPLILVGSSQHGDIPAVPCHAKLGCQPGTQTQSSWFQVQGSGTKGCFDSLTLQVCPWSGQFAVSSFTSTSSMGVIQRHISS